MGGKAFTHLEPPLSTPRLPPHVYWPLREALVTLVAKYYKHASSPLEAPEKDSYGDIDILTSEPLGDLETLPDDLGKALHAKATINAPGRGSRSYAVPYPGSDSEFVQVDVHVCHSATYTWELFTHSHGDLWNLLGTSIRPFGLTANDVGLHLRIAEIEELNRKKSLLFLTADPSSVLQFLGLSVDRYWQPFETSEQMFCYATGMRFFRRDTYIRETLKANDRKRMTQRPMYRKFVDEWLPAQPDVGKAEEWSPVLRKGVLEEALDVYKKGKEYEERLEAWKVERRELIDRQIGNEARRAMGRDARETKQEFDFCDTAWLGISEIDASPDSLFEDEVKIGLLGEVDKVVPTEKKRKLEARCHEL